MKLLRQINIMERLDQLIRLGATGNLDELARKLNVSVSTVKRQIELMKLLGAPVFFNFAKQRYEYRYKVDFVYGFSHNGDQIKERIVKLKLKENKV